jgi:hypothetical protein
MGWRTRRIEKKVRRILVLLTEPTIVFWIGPVTEQKSAPSINRANERPQCGRIVAMFQLTDSQECELNVVFTDKKGNPVQDVHDLTWGVDNSNLLTLTPPADGNPAKISAVGPLGTALVSVQDADDQIAGTLEVQIVSGAPVEITIEPGTPTEQQ